MSEWLRQWQITGEVPYGVDVPPEMAFWAGWLVGMAKHGTARTHDQARAMAIKIAEFIEGQAAK